MQPTLGRPLWGTGPPLESRVLAPPPILLPRIPCPANPVPFLWPLCEGGFPNYGFWEKSTLQSLQVDGTLLSLWDTYLGNQKGIQKPGVARSLLSFKEGDNGEGRVEYDGKS